jgi:hypothetical protein
VSGAYGDTPGFWVINNEDTSKRIFFPLSGFMSGYYRYRTEYFFFWVSDYAMYSTRPYSFAFGGIGTDDESQTNIAFYQMSWYYGVPVRAIYHD